MKKNISFGRRAVAGIVLDNSDNILIGKKREGSEGFLSGLWHIPGETLEKEENYEEGLIRGMKEEAGIDIKVQEYLGSHKTPKHTLVKWYKCSPKSLQISAGSDLREVRWVPIKEVFKLCSEASKFWPDSIKDYLNNEKN